MSEFVKYVSSPSTYTLKRWFMELLKEKFPKHEGIVERVGPALVTDKDLKDFGALVTELYESAYRKAIADYRTEFEKLGVKINVVTEQPANH